MGKIKNKYVFVLSIKQSGLQVMDTDLLDDDLFVTKRIKVQPATIHRISIIMLWVGIGSCIAFGLIYESKVIAAIILLSIATITNYYIYKIGTKITMVLIVLGVFDLISFTPYSYQVSFGIGRLQITLEVILLAIFILHYFTNRSVLSNFLSNVMTVKTSEEEKQVIERNSIDGFKTRFY